MVGQTAYLSLLASDMHEEFNSFMILDLKAFHILQNTSGQSPHCWVKSPTLVVVATMLVTSPWLVGLLCGLSLSFIITTGTIAEAGKDYSMGEVVVQLSHAKGNCQ